MANFGVTTAAIEAMANGMTLSATSRPSSTQVSAWIGQSARRASSAIRAAGADPDSIDLAGEGEGYDLAAQFVQYDAASLTLLARDREETGIAKAYREQAAQILKEIRTWAAALGDQRNTGTDAPGLTYAPVFDAVDELPTKDAAFWRNATGQL